MKFFLPAAQRGTFLLILLVIALALNLGCLKHQKVEIQEALPEPVVEPEILFGSAAILEACWTPEELQGKARDKIVRLSSPPGAGRPPERTEPVNALAPLPEELRHSIRRVEPVEGQKPMALTFDLCETRGETAGYDDEIVNYLRDEKVKATFFAGGKWMRSHPEKAMQLMADPLFEVGNHSWSHAPLHLADEKIIAEQVLWPQAEYELLRETLLARPCAQGAGEAAAAQIPVVPTLFRFPYGTCGKTGLDFTAAHGLTAIQWDVVGYDTDESRGADQIARTVLSRTRPGSIVILHANGRGIHTAEALKIAVPKLREQGYAFVTVSELLAAGAVVASPECYENRPGDTGRYDHPVQKEKP